MAQEKSWKIPIHIAAKKIRTKEMHLKVTTREYNSPHLSQLHFSLTILSILSLLMVVQTRVGGAPPSLAGQ